MTIIGVKLLMNTRLLEYFIAVCEEKSITKAAAKLYTSQSNVSKYISSLESELGIQLFYREHRSVTLTKEGQRYYERIKNVPEILYDAEIEARSTRQEADNTITIGIQEGYQPDNNYLKQLALLLKEYPECNIIIEKADFNELGSGLLNHHYDLIYTLLFTIEHQAGVNTILHREREIYVAMHEENPLSMHTGISLQDLNGQRLLILSKTASPEAYSNLLSQLKAADVHAEVHFVNSSESIFIGVEANLGLGIVDDGNRLKNNSHVRFLPIAEKLAPAKYGFAWLRYNRKPMLIKIIEKIEKQESEYPRIRKAKDSNYGSANSQYR